MTGRSLLIERLIEKSEAYGKATYLIAAQSYYITEKDRKFFYDRGIDYKTAKQARSIARESLLRLASICFDEYSIKTKGGKRPLIPSDILETFDKGFFQITSNDIKFGYKELHLKKSRDKWKCDFIILLSSNQIVDCRNSSPKEIKDMKKLQKVIKK